MSFGQTCNIPLYKKTRVDMKRFFALLLTGALVVGTVGCTNMNRTQQGSLSGAAGGALLGAGISALAGGSSTTGALIGGGLGALAGGIYGHQQEQRRGWQHF